MDTPNSLEERNDLYKSRLGNCEVCADRSAKYTCPECEVKTCCLQCVKIHKQELACSGIRNKVKFKPIHKMNTLDLQSDYLLLEGTQRIVDGLVKNEKNLNRLNFHSVARMKMKNGASKRNINLLFLPKCFSRHKENSTYYHWKSDEIFWKIKWIFPEVGMFSVVDIKVPESELVINSLSKYINPEKCNPDMKKHLIPYLEVDNSSITVLLKLEYFGPNKFSELDKNNSWIENLSKKTIIEHLIVYVIFETSSSKYDIVKRENNAGTKFSNIYKGTNLLFDHGEIEDK